MNHETHLPAQQIEAQAQIRIPSSHEDCRRTKSNPTQTQSGTKGSCRLKPSDRLKKRHEFQAFKQGFRLVGRFICVDQRKGSSLRFGITASGRYGNSPERNRFKRLVREAFRTAKHLLPPSLELHIIPRQKAKEAKMMDIQKEILSLLKENPLSSI
jgi:ribonuclease P protein component